MTLAEKIFNCFKDNESFSLKEAYQQNVDKPKETVRARIYEKIGIRFKRISKGVYYTIDNKDEQNFYVVVSWKQGAGCWTC